MPAFNLPSDSRFKVYVHSFTFEDGQQIERPFIVLKDPDGSIRFTDYHKYAVSKSKRIRNITSNSIARCKAVAPLLNYCVYYCGLKSLKDLSVDMVKDYLRLYARRELPWDDEDTHRSEDTVARTAIYIFDYCEQMIQDKGLHCRLKKNDLYTYVDKRDRRTGKVISVKTPVFDIECTGGRVRKIFRDMPDKAFEVLFQHIAEAHPELLGVAMLGAFCGLRPSEACNIRRVDSPLGPGLLFKEEFIGGRSKVVEVEYDLRKEYTLRSDLISVGKIKKERKRKIPEIFLPAFVKTYNFYMQYLLRQKCEKEYCPFSVNKQGKAMTYASYLEKFHRMIKEEMIPIYLASDDAVLVLFGHMLMEHNLSPHVFRHWFTVQLVLAGMSIDQVQYYRGDNSPDSAFTYLQEKGDLERQYRKVTNKTFEYLSWAAGPGRKG